MALTKPQIVDLYRRRSSHYDVSARLYWLIGFRYDRYRRLAVDALALEPGDTVVEIACGTGLNFPLIEERIGRAGHLVGVDLTDAMLDEARRRVEHGGWDNVELVLSDAAGYALPRGVDGVLSTAAISLVPEYDAVIGRAHAALAPGGRISIFDFDEPDRAPDWLVRLMVELVRPFGGTLDVVRERDPAGAVARHFPIHAKSEVYGGFAYVVVGRKETET